MSEQIPGFKSEAYPDAISDNAKRLGLLLPEIAVSETLEYRLLRHKQVIEFDPLNLLEGVTNSDIERPIRAQIDSHPLDSPKMPPKITGFRDGGFNKPYSFTLALTSTKEAPLSEDLSLLNRTFWLGALVTDRLADGATGERTPGEKRKIAGAVFGSQTISLAANSEIFRLIPTVAGRNIEGGLAGAFLGVGGVVAYNIISRRPKNIQKILTKRLSKKAADLAEAHPVIDIKPTLEA